MAELVKEVWTYKRMTASGQLAPRGGKVGFFVCTTGGTLQITEGEGAGGSDIVSSLTLVAKDRVDLGLHLPSGAWAVLGGGCVGTFGV